ncbi:DUF262 domain-containing protein [Limisalsivibrio acetivorans]|uniref:DUF262 domain-containing protein n=1 Tax=Limisalsivibrio acetivorans TaxID=1304888 RepID=UPI0003B41C8A|nr:DUF262 domain-containing protein [Limisalsivibrio acetivorans]
MTLESLFVENESNKIVLPDFQRDMEWKEDKQKKLLASFLVKLPIGNLLLLNGNKDDFLAREIGAKNQIIEPKEDCSYLLDGQQRFTSLKLFFCDLYYDENRWKQKYEDVYSQLRARWFINVKPQVNGEDVFGYNNLSFQGIDNCEPDDVLDFLVSKKIYKTKTHEWHSPGFDIKDDNGNKMTSNRMQLQVIRMAAEECLIPLYSLYPYKRDNLHDQVIRKIAIKRKEDLQAELGDDKNQIINLLKDVEPSIEEFLDDNEQYSDEIAYAWSGLAERWSAAVSNYLNNLLKQAIPVIELPADQISRAIAIFTTINEGGQKLNTFDLVVAKAAKDTKHESLSKRIADLYQKDVRIPDAVGNGQLSSWVPNNFKLVIDNKIVREAKDHFLNILSLFTHSRKILFNANNRVIKIDLLKNAKQLELDYEKINSNTKETVIALARAYAFLQLRCGITIIEKLPYKLMVVPIAYMLSFDEVWGEKKSIDKLEYWYWASLFSGAYREGQNEKCINDIYSLYEWISNKGENPFIGRLTNIFQDTRYSDLDTLLLKNEDSVPKAIYSGILQYILSNLPGDFIPRKYSRVRLSAYDVAINKKIEVKSDTGDELTYVLSLNDHHIVPFGSVKKLNESADELRQKKDHILNSPLNRTYISAKANEIIRDMEPEKYFSEIDEIVQYGHMVPTPIQEKYQRRDSEDEYTYYQRVLEERFHELKRNVCQELDKLSS